MRKLIVKQRRKIETFFSQLNEQFHIEHVLAQRVNLIIFNHIFIMGALNKAV